MKTTDLLKLNLTDFLNEVEQDLKNLKYNSKLESLQVITDVDIDHFIQRQTCDFDLQKMELMYNDICRWEFGTIGVRGDDDMLPYITKQMKEAIEIKTYNLIYQKTTEALKLNENYRDVDFEAIEMLYFLQELPILLAKSCEGYSDAIFDYKNGQTNVSAGEPQQTIIPDSVLQQLQEQGLIENTTARPLKWLKTKILLAYFVDVANDRLKLKHGQKRMIKGFELLFNVSGLGHCVNDYKNKTGTLPIGHEHIDKIIF